MDGPALLHWVRSIIDRGIRKLKQVHGSDLTPYGIFLLAESYHEAADIVTPKHVRRFSDNPARLLYLHALEGNFRA